MLHGHYAHIGVKYFLRSLGLVVMKSVECLHANILPHNQTIRPFKI
jgi:hypothetical protein